MEMRHVRFGVQSRMNPHRPQHSLGLILNALHTSLRDERGFSSQLLSMHSKSSALAGTWGRPPTPQPIDRQGTDKSAASVEK